MGRLQERARSCYSRQSCMRFTSLTDQTAIKDDQRAAAQDETHPLQESWTKLLQTHCGVSKRVCSTVSLFCNSLSVLGRGLVLAGALGRMPMNGKINLQPFSATLHYTSQSINSILAACMINTELNTNWLLFSTKYSACTSGYETLSQ